MEKPKTQDAPGWMVEALEIGEAEAEAGETVPLEDFLAELRESIARMEASQAGHDSAAE